MQEIKGIRYKQIILLKVVTIILLTIVLIYYLMFFIWAFDASTEYDSTFRELYSKVNPFTLGAYALGIVALLYNFLFKHVIIKAIIWIVYFLVIVFTLIALMGMVRLIDLLIYLPHLFIIVGGIIGTFKSKIHFTKN